MSRFASPSRRSIMRGCLGAVIGALTAMLPSAVRATAFEPKDRVLAHLLPHRESARAIGLAYLAVAPEEKSAERLRQQLGHLTDATTMAEQVRNDFATGRIVVIDSWALSITEARACALIALS